MDKVLEQLAAAGLDVQQPEFGRLVRCRTEDDKGRKQSGWYVLHEIVLDSGERVVVGRYGNWKRFGNEAQKIEFNRPGLSAAERQRLEQEQRKLREKAAAERRQRAEEAATRARRMWGKLPDAGASEYLARKKVGAWGVRFTRGTLVVPVCNLAGLAGLQFIQADGEKKFLTGTAQEGSWHFIGEIPDDYAQRLWIGEGYATCATVHQAIGEPVVVAFNAGNLQHVAKAMQAKYPRAQLVIAADNDRFTKHPTTGAPWNPGVEYAGKAAMAVGARVVTPAFSNDDGRSTDFNDLHVTCGLKAAREQLLAGLDAQPVPPEESPAPPLDDAPPLAPDIPPAPPWQLSALTLDKALERFALVMPDGKVWDSHTRQLLKKTVARDLIGKKLFEQWLNHEERRTTDKSVVGPAAQAASAAGGGGLFKALARYVYLYPSSDAWDREKRQRVPLSALKHAIADCFDAWIKSDRREEIDVDRLVFDPTQRVDDSHINTFRGLPMTPQRDDSKCRAIVELITHLCNNNADVVVWMMTWLAYPLQHVGAKMATAVLMHSHQQGSGKSLFFEEIIKPLYGEYASTLSQHQLESQYTDWRSQLLFGLFEEIFSRDQKYSHTGTLKHMITGKTQRIEKKFVSGWEEANYMNAVFLSNEIQPFPVDPTDRRMLVVWPRTKMPPDLKGRVLQEVRNGGVQAFYALLLDFPLNGFGTHTEPPMTEEKERLIDFGRPAWEVFFFEWKGRYIDDAPYMPCLTEQLFTVYRRWCDRRREHVVSFTKFGGFLAVQDGVTRRRDVHYFSGQTKSKGTFFLPREPDERFTQNEGENQEMYLGRCVSTFREISTPRQDMG